MDVNLSDKIHTSNQDLVLNIDVKLTVYLGSKSIARMSTTPTTFGNFVERNNM